MTSLYGVHSGHRLEVETILEVSEEEGLLHLPEKGSLN